MNFRINFRTCCLPGILKKTLLQISASSILEKNLKAFFLSSLHIEPNLNMMKCDAFWKSKPLRQAQRKFLLNLAKLGCESKSRECIITSNLLESFSAKVSSKTTCDWILAASGRYSFTLILTLSRFSFTSLAFRATWVFVTCTLRLPTLHKRTSHWLVSGVFFNSILFRWFYFHYSIRTWRVMFI